MSPPTPTFYTNVTADDWVEADPVSTTEEPTLTPAEYAYLDLFIGNFSARTDGYVLDSRQHINEPLIPETLAHHWAGGHSVSGYTGNGDLTNVGAIDLDEGDLDEARMVRSALDDAGIPSLLCPSRRGAHLWTFHSTMDSNQVESRIVRAALTMAVGVSGWPHPMSKAEVFPRRGTSDWSCGALRFPLMAHPKDGVARPVLTMHDEVLISISEVVMCVATMTSDYESMRAFSDIDNADRPPPKDLGEWRQRVTREDEVPSISALLMSLGVSRATPGHACHCPFHDDTHSSLSISKDDERVFCKAPHCDLFRDGNGMGSFQLAAYIRERHAAS